MIDPVNVPTVANGELLARFILSSSHIRSSDESVKADAFIPYRYTELSVTRHLNASEPEIWRAGESVADECRKPLHGRADVLAAKCIDNGLEVLADPVDGNPNHADVSGWPSQKHEQKVIALLLADGIRAIRRR